MEENEVEKIYIVHGTDENGSHYVEKFLIQYKNYKEVYETLPFSYDSLSALDKAKAKKQLCSKLVHQYLDHLKKDESQKVIVVSKNKPELLKYVNQRILSIQALEKNPSKRVEEQFLKSSSFPSDFFFQLLSTKKWKKLRFENSFVFRKLKWVISIFILSLGVTYGAKHLSIDLDAFTQKFSFQKEKDQDFSNSFVNFQDSRSEGQSTFVTVDDAAVNVLMEVLDTNPSINEQDAMIAESLRQYLIESSYFDYEKCYQDFRDLKIMHSNNIDGNYGAISFLDKKVIQTYYSKDKDPSLYRADLEHELTHFTGFLQCSFLNEGIVSLIVSEYMENFELTNFYYDQIIATKILCELITPEKMLEAYQKRDDSIIQGELLKINSDPSDYYSLLSLFNEYHNEYIVYAERGEVEKFFSFSYEKYNQKFQELFSNYLVSDYISVEQKEHVLAYLSYLGCQTNVTGVVYFNREVDRSDFIKGYQEPNDLIDNGVHLK